MFEPADFVSDCVVVGGGVIGLSIAWELLNRGLSCSIVDQATIEKSCSWAGAGILPPARLDTACDPLEELRGLSHALHPSWSERLLEVTGIDNGYRRCGGVYLATSLGEAAALTGQAGYWSEYGIESVSLTLEELLRFEPALSRDYAERSLKTAWWTPDEAQIRPPAHLEALLKACQHAGAKILQSTPVTRLRPTDRGSADLLLTPTQPTGSTLSLAESTTWRIECGGEGSAVTKLEAKHVVLASGAWASRFADPIGKIDDVFPVRGQAVLFQAPVGMLNAIINEGHRYLVPRKDGVIYVGSNEEEVGLTLGTTPEVIDSLKAWACRWVPALLQAPLIRQISGLRPGSMDGFPHIGRSPNFDGLYFATGHFRSGLHLSCATAVVIADLICGQAPKLKSLSLTAVR